MGNPRRSGTDAELREPPHRAVGAVCCREGMVARPESDVSAIQQHRCRQRRDTVGPRGPAAARTDPEQSVRQFRDALRVAPVPCRSGNAVACVDYEPGESTTALFGGNSNWRGPVWFPLNVLLIEALHRYNGSLSETQHLEYPAGSGVHRTLVQIADNLSARLVSLFLLGTTEHMPQIPAIRRYRRRHAGVTTSRFTSTTTATPGQGLGASHQTGSTSLVAHLIVTRAKRGRSLN
jgi:hypothetical protein